MSNKLLTVSLAPHFTSGNSIPRLMYGVVIALLPAFIVSIMAFGFDAIRLTLIAVLSAVVFEFLIQKFLLKIEHHRRVWSFRRKFFAEMILLSGISTSQGIFYPVFALMMQDNFEYAEKSINAVLSFDKKQRSKLFEVYREFVGESRY